MDEIKVGYIVKFKDNATSTAGKFCNKHNLPGAVIGIEQSRYVVSTGIGYNIYAPYDELEIIETHGGQRPQSLRPVPQHILQLVPPIDDYQN